MKKHLLFLPSSSTNLMLRVAYEVAKIQSTSTSNVCSWYRVASKSMTFNTVLLQAGFYKSNTMVLALVEVV